MADYFTQEDGILAFLNADKFDAQLIGEAMEEISRQPGGLTPRRFQEAARNPSHPAHKHLEWDNEQCVEKWRDAQCRSIFRTVWTVEPASDKETRAFVSLRSDRPGGYRTISSVLSSSELTDRFLAQALEDLEAIERKYRSLKEIVELVAAARSKISARRRKGRGGQPSAH